MKRGERLIIIDKLIFTLLFLVNSDYIKFNNYLEFAFFV